MCDHLNEADSTHTFLARRLEQLVQDNLVLQGQIVLLEDRLDDPNVVEFMLANERMGHALDYIYQKYPSIKDEVLDYVSREGWYNE